jgi:hypothetical protein
VFARNLEKIRAVAEGSKEGKIDITSVFRTYLEKHFNEYAANTPLDQITVDNIKEKVVKEALKEAYHSRDDFRMEHETATRAYEELVQVVETLTAQDPLLNDVFDLYFGSTIDQIRMALSESK